MRGRLGCVTLAVVAACAVAAPAQAGSSKINAYRVKASAKNLEKLALAGFDVTEGRRAKGKIEVYGTAKQIARLSSKSKVRAKLVRDRKGRTSAQRSRTKVRRGLAKLGLRSLKAHGNPTALASDAGYQIYRKYDAVDGDGREQYTEFYDRILSTYPNITAERVIGQTEWHRDIIAIQVSKNPTGADNDKPAFLYNAMQHARERLW